MEDVVLQKKIKLFVTNPAAAVSLTILPFPLKLGYVTWKV